MNIRDFIDIVEAALIQEAIVNEEAVSIFRMAYRSWYNPANEEWVAVSPSGSHVKDVVADPTKFGLTFEDLGLPPGGLSEANTRTAADLTADRNPVVMTAMCSRGWIRVAASERNDPGKFIIFEGMNLRAMEDLFMTVYVAFRGKIDNTAFKVRRGDGVAREYQINGRDMVRQYADGEYKPKPTTTKNDQIAA